MTAVPENNFDSRTPFYGFFLSLLGTLVIPKVTIHPLTSATVEALTPIDFLPMKT